MKTTENLTSLGKYYGGDIMSSVDTVIEFIRKQAMEHPEKSWGKITAGFKANKIKTKFLPNKNLSKGYQQLENMMMSLIADSLGKENSYVWGNIFAPCEIMNCFNLKTISIECMSCYLSGYHLEDFFIDWAQDLGIAPTLCSYHKTFVGAVESGVVKVPSYAITTSLTCDGNLNTFRYFQKTKGVPFTLLDVPYEKDEASIQYLADQMRELTQRLSEQTGIPFQEEMLREQIHIENETRKELKKFLKLLMIHRYPGQIISYLYLMMGMHLLIGTKEFLELVRFLVKDIQTYEKFEGKKILWVHLLPYYQESLQEYFNGNNEYQLIPSDMVLDYTGILDEEHPFEALAEKTIENLYNGSYAHKAEILCKFAEDLHVDGVIHFCHWGCKQASGGSILLKEEMKQHHIPMLILDGDGIDRRNSHDGQIKTRLEAFLEMIDDDGGNTTC